MSSGFSKWVAGLGVVVAALGAPAQAQTAHHNLASYTIGAGDEIRITVYGQSELAAETQVSADGMVMVPLLGNLPIAGKTSADAAALIASRYEAGNVLKNAQVNLLVTKYRSQVVAILGKVNNPGKLVLEGPTSLTQALAWAGGISPSGSERIVLMRITREGKQERTEYDLQQLLHQENELLPTVWLRNGDTIYVPNAGRFYLNGEVHTPGMYPLDRPLSIRQALSAGGGPTARASENSVKLFRQQENGAVKELKAKPDDQVQDGDVLVVKESLF
ncbi:polysaccharide biosynthesis/export family protein [Cellvibrio sp. UBA7661]|uniref:polysaccharide biosynthesis/export family protein n=1 Tax=Cellvibrio sp. UBA7661 TaxID=1946311 RepID=UPI002F353303